MDEKKDDAINTSDATTEHASDPKSALEASANQLEHELTLKEVFKHHKVLVWWCFYWAMAAVGWWVAVTPPLSCTKSRI